MKTRSDIIEERAQTIDAMVDRWDRLWEEHDQLVAQRDALREALEHALAYMEADSDDTQEQADHAQAKSALALCEKEGV